MDYYDCHEWNLHGYPGEFVHGDDVYLDEYYMDQRWLPVVGAPDYWVSDKGMVWSTIKNRFISGTATSKGYVYFTLRVGDRYVRKYLHKMIAEAFIPNPNKLQIVRHYDDNGWNNYIDNLRWGTQVDNMQDCIRNGNFRFFTSEDIEKANEVRRTPIVAIRLSDGETCHFVSQQEASRQLNIDQSSINGVLNGRNKSARGYFFVYESEYGPEFNFVHTDYRYQRKKNPIRAFNTRTGEKCIFMSPTEASKLIDISQASISLVLHNKQDNAKGWKFEYMEDRYDY